jgi:hypothetical protein
VWCISSSLQPVWSVSRVWQSLLAAATRTAVFDMSAVTLCKPMPPYIQTELKVETDKLASMHQLIYAAAAVSLFSE